MTKKIEVSDVEVVSVTIGMARRAVRGEDGRPVRGPDVGNVVNARYTLKDKEGKTVAVEGSGNITLFNKVPDGVNKDDVDLMSADVKKAYNALMKAVAVQVKKHEGV